MTHYPSRLRFKLSERAQRELDEKNCTILTDDEMMQLLLDVYTISDRNKSPDLVTV